MRNKVIGGAIAVCVVLGGAYVVGASKGSDDVEKRVAPVSGEIVENVETETVNGETTFTVERGDSAPASTNTKWIPVADAMKIATDEVNGKITKMEREYEHGRLIYKFDIQTDSGEADVRIDAETGKITRSELDND